MGIMKYRPRFSVRSLAIVVTLVCAYFGAWEATKRHVDSIKQPEPRVRFITSDGRVFPYGISQVDAPLPFIVARTECHITPYRDTLPRRQYYLWLLGPTIKLPFESKLK